MNVSYFDGLAEGDIKILPGLGAQAGAEIRFDKFALLVGAQVISLTGEWSTLEFNGGTSFRSEGKTTIFYSGVISQLSYTF